MSIPVYLFFKRIKEGIEKKELTSAKGTTKV